MKWDDVKDLLDYFKWPIIGIVGIIILIIWLTHTETGEGLLAAGGVLFFLFAFGSMGSDSKSRLCSILSTIIKTIICIYLWHLISITLELHATTMEQRLLSYCVKGFLVLVVLSSFYFMFKSLSNISKKEQEEKEHLS